MNEYLIILLIIMTVLLCTCRSQYDGLQSSALSRLSDLEEALLTVGRFEEAHQELRNWLGQAWDLLQGAEPIPGQSEAVIALLAKHRVGHFNKKEALKLLNHLFSLYHSSLACIHWLCIIIYI